MAEIVVGLTGMSGAGKTTACSEFAASGFEIVNCDLISRQVVTKGSRCLAEIEKAFGDVILPNGELDRKKIAGIVFTSDEKREQFNNIIYPYISYIVIDKIVSWSGKILLDAPTLFESGIDSLCGCVVSVVCDRQTSVERIMKRDNLTLEQAENRLSSQHDADFYKEKSDYCAENNGTEEHLKEKIRAIIAEIGEKVDSKSK